MRTLFLAALLVIHAARAAPAQQPTDTAPLVTQRLDSGTVVRLRLRGDVIETGRLVAPFARDSPAFTYCPWPGSPCATGAALPVVRPARGVLGLEVHRGSAWKSFAAIGAVLGVPMGLEFAQWRYLDDEGVGGTVTPSQKIRTVLVTSAVLALFGAMLGEFFQFWGPAP